MIGRRVVPQLLAAGQRVTAVARTEEKRVALARLGATPVALDLFDAADVRVAVTGHDVVMNLATHIPKSSRMFLPGAWRENSRIRRVASAHLAEAAIAAGARRFVQESFAPTYPDSGERWIDEETPLQPARYNRAVLDTEAAAERFTRSGGAGVVLRFAAFYGPDAEHVIEMIPFVRKGWAPLPGAAFSFISSVSHDDAAAAVVAALDARAGVYNVVDDEPVTHREYFDTLARALGVAPPRLPPAFVTHLLGSLGRTVARSLRISNRKLRAECGWAPKYPSVREGWRAVAEALSGAVSPQLKGGDDQ